MKKNLVQKFRKFYFALPKDERIALYDIMTALRGEDDGSYELKIFTTARVRGALFGVSERDFAKRGFVFASLKKAKAYNKKCWTGEEASFSIRKKWRDANDHFKEHIKSAIEALKRHGSKSTISDLVEFTRSIDLKYHPLD